MNESGSDCGQYDSYTTTRFVLICLASIIALLGIAANLTLFVVFYRLTKQNRSQSNKITDYLTLATLSILDAFVCFCFSFIFGLDALALYLGLELFFHTYFMLIVIIFTLSGMVHFTMSYLIIVVTFEKWLVTSNNYQIARIAQTVTADIARFMIVGIVLVVTAALRLPQGWSYYVRRFPECTDVFGSVQLYPTNLTASETYVFYELYIMSFLDVFLPFIALLTLNGAVLYNTKLVKTSGGLVETSLDLAAISIGICTSTMRGAYTPDRFSAENAMLEEERKDREKEAKETTVSIVAIVTGYLLCHAPSFILAVLERFYQSSLVLEDGVTSTNLYLFWADMVSVLFMFNSCLNPFIFYKWNEVIRNEMNRLCYFRLG